MCFIYQEAEAGPATKIAINCSGACPELKFPNLVAALDLVDAKRFACTFCLCFQAGEQVYGSIVVVFECLLTYNKL